VPLIDHRLIEASFNTTPAVVIGRVRPPRQGAPPRRAASASSDLCTNRPKMGFTFPLADWLRGPWRPATISTWRRPPAAKRQSLCRRHQPTFSKTSPAADSTGRVRGRYRCSNSWWARAVNSGSDSQSAPAGRALHRKPGPDQHSLERVSRLFASTCARYRSNVGLLPATQHRDPQPNRQHPLGPPQSG